MADALDAPVRADPRCGHPTEHRPHPWHNHHTGEAWMCPGIHLPGCGQTLGTCTCPEAPSRMVDAQGLTTYDAFVDRTGSWVIVQQSGAVADMCVWLSTQHPRATGVQPHLDCAMARRLIGALQAFVDECEEGS